MSASPSIKHYIGKTSGCTIYRASEDDIEFYRSIFDQCANPAHGLLPFNENWKGSFYSEDAVVQIPIQKPTEVIHLYVIYQEGTRIGIMTNRRYPSSGRERLGILLSPDLQARGLGAPLIRFMADWRKEQAVQNIGAHVAEVHGSCLRMVEKAGGEYRGNSVEKFGHLNVLCREYEF